MNLIKYIVSELVLLNCVSLYTTFCMLSD